MPCRARRRAVAAAPRSRASAARRRRFAPRRRLHRRHRCGTGSPARARRAPRPRLGLSEEVAQPVQEARPASSPVAAGSAGERRDVGVVAPAPSRVARQLVDEARRACPSSSPRRQTPSRPPSSSNGDGTGVARRPRPRSRARSGSSRPSVSTAATVVRRRRRRRQAALAAAVADHLVGVAGVLAVGDQAVDDRAALLRRCSSAAAAAARCAGSGTRRPRRAAGARSEPARAAPRGGVPPSTHWQPPVRQGCSATIAAAARAGLRPSARRRCGRRLAGGARSSTRSGARAAAVAGAVSEAADQDPCRRLGLYPRTRPDISMTERSFWVATPRPEAAKA